MTKELIKQIDDFISYLQEYDYELFSRVLKYSNLRRHISIYEYINSIFVMSEYLDKEPLVIIRELFSDD